MKDKQNKANQDVVISKEKIEAYINEFSTHENQVRAYVVNHYEEVKSGVEKGYLKEEILQYNH